MEFINFLNRDITVHTSTFTYRGVLVETLIGILHFKINGNDFYIDASKVVAVTVHETEIIQHHLVKQSDEDRIRVEEALTELNS